MWGRVTLADEAHLTLRAAAASSRTRRSGVRMVQAGVVGWEEGEGEGKWWRDVDVGRMCEHACTSA